MTQERQKFLDGGGLMGELISAYDWENSPIGPPATWPQPLKTSIRLLLTTGHPMVLWWGTDLIQFYNDAYSRSMGPEKHPSALGRKAREVWTETWSTIGPQITHVMTEGGSTWHQDQLVPVFRHGAMDSAYWTYSLSPIYDPKADNGVGGVLVICSETTEQVQSKRVIESAEMHWRELFNQIRGFLCILREPAHLFKFANPQFHALLGNPPELIGRTVNEALPELKGQGYIARLDKVFQTGESYMGDAVPLRLRDSNGKEKTHYVNVSFQAIRESNGDVAGILIDGYDVTDRVLASKSLEEEDKRKDEFLAMLAHELRNPLAPIRNASELLLRSPSDDGNIKVLGELLGRQVTQLTHIVDDLLDISRITQGRISLQREALNIDHTMSQVLDALQEVALQKNHQLSYRKSARALYIDGDVTRITQCISNIVHNAIKYTQPGGLIRVSLSEEDGNALIEIGDNGQGIAPDMLDKVFELFSQENQTLDRAQGGLGIGLAIVNRLIKMHGGTVVAISEGPGHGATFRMTLPLVDAPEKTGSKNDEGFKISRRVLVVDDNVDAASSLAELLNAMGHQASAVFDGKTAIDYVNKFSPEIVFLDIGLPDISGYEVAKTLRARQQELFLIALTGYGQSDDIEDARKAGFDVHFTKPVSMDDINAVLNA